jgi:hypothetical protein
LDNDNIKQLLQNFLLNASIIVFKNVEFNPPTKEIYEIQEGKSGAIRFQKIDFSRIVNSFKQKIIDLEDFKKLFDFIKTNIKYYVSHLDTLQHIPFFLLIDFCKNHSMYINKNGKLSIDDLANQLNNFDRKMVTTAFRNSNGNKRKNDQKGRKVFEMRMKRLVNLE